MGKIRTQFLIVAIAVAFVGCGQQTQINDSQSTVTEKQAGMSEFEYLASDGGPHLVLPKELSGKWKGSSGFFFLLSSKNDYARACAATTNQLMALLPVGTGQAIVLGNPPLSAWGHSPEGWIDIYNLQAWADTNTDALIKHAVTNTPTNGMKDSGKAIKLNQPGLVLLFAGDKPGNTAYGEHAIPIDAGSYRILEGHYKPQTNEEIFIYRLQPNRN
ncbi:MAG: Imm21 family immunity protein [Verrucomicrobiales bacterium]|nr:Imm21 family immunity protein [Verrucomicrobiales bacterium]